MQTDYAQLPADEKDSDRVEATRILDIVRAHDGKRELETERAIYEHFKRLGCFDPGKETKELIETLAGINGGG